MGQLLHMQNKIPSSLITSLQTVKGFEKEAFLQAHEENQHITSVRFNPAKKISSQQCELPLDEKIPWSTNGYYLTERPSFTTNPLFHAGVYYVQEASSMFLEEAIKQTCNLSSSIKVLDLCAAPGGKSTLIQSLISESSLLVSNEVIKTRVSILAENITKSGAANVVVTNNDPADFKKLNCFFDMIVVDAPCSGSGLFRKDPAAINEWSPENVNLCSHRQQRILADVMPALKPGGVLIYSTCSYSAEENENISDWLLENHQLESKRMNISTDWNIVETKAEKSRAFGYRFYPDKLKGEGFFISVFKKSEKEDCIRELKSKIKQDFVSKTDMEILQSWVIIADTYSFIKWKDSVLAFPSDCLQELSMLQSALYIKKAGVNIGNIIRNDFIPSHELAMSNIKSNKIVCIELDTENTLQYLRHQLLKIEVELKGWVLITYKGVALGFIKSMPSRINNYYPREWRILNK